MTASRCESCDLPLDQCEHGRPTLSRMAAPKVLDVSPTEMAHLPGCPHKGDDPNFSHWGLITQETAAAWQALGNGQPV